MHVSLQLSFDFPEDHVGARREDAAAEYARAQLARTLLRELAVALGEQRAMSDIEAYRTVVTMPNERE